MKVSQLSAYAASHRGQRDYNEDSHLIDLELGLVAVADGMGGYAKGDEASQLALDTLHDEVDLGESLSQAFEQCQVAIKAAAARGEGGPSMGTTLVAASFDDGLFELAWLGDSRGYCWDGSALLQLTRDHSYVEKLLADGIVTAAEAATRQDRNILTQALWAGGDDQLQVDTVSASLYRGERLLLCSDGLSDALSGGQIAQILSAEQSLKSCTEALINAALAAGARDNITVLLVANEQAEPISLRPKPEPVAVFQPQPPLASSRAKGKAVTAEGGAQPGLSRRLLMVLGLGLVSMGLYLYSGIMS
ncbi:MAG: protein phosphatase 2C domain-containing protein [Cellvibrionaceae bacterium]|nr:protein phosphatase 2C domain-containing protein [Cellvibrionaceae bacterium]MCV6625025.1 protein phosphatase 2C domain-containing protein [Cellvibrionaceae bacterium]